MERARGTANGREWARMEGVFLTAKNAKIAKQVLKFGSYKVPPVAKAVSSSVALRVRQVGQVRPVGLVRPDTIAPTARPIPA
jgi:hypothetical protein